MIQLWSPRSRMIADDEFLQQVVALEQRGTAPFHGARLDVIAGISRLILADPIGMAQPQFVALAYWMRRSALTRMKAHWLERHVDPNELPIARGVALHLPPTNVDTIFVYSWVLSFLAGNTNIVRLPSQRSASVEWLIAIIVDALHDAGMGTEHLFCAFDHDNDTLSRISRCCDLRLIWGGDAKVNAVSQFPLRPDGLSIGFPDRSSATMIASAVYLASDDAQRDALASSLFNDVFWFDQMGCGSPRVVFWIDRDGRNGMADLAVRLDRVAKRRGYAGEPAVAVAKMVSSYGMLADSYAQHVERYSNALDIVYSDVTADAMRPAKQGGGLLTSVTVGNIVDVAAWVRRDVQTITHHGLSRDDLTRLAETISVRGGYRLVPVGMALAFGDTWDGIPLLTHMTRRIVIQL